MPKHLFFLWILALVYLSKASAAPTVQLDAIPAWNGYFKPGKPTELRVQLLSDRGGIFSVQTGKLITRVELTANTPYNLAMPFQADGPPDAHFIRVHRQDGPNVSAAQQLSLTATNNRIIAFVSNQLSIDERQILSQAMLTTDKADFLAVNSESLPQSAIGYAAIDLLVMSYNDLKTLQDRQINALSAYLTQCGKMIAIAFPETIHKQLQATAGCHGEFLTTAAAIGDLSQQFHNLINRNAAQLPNPAIALSASKQTKFFSPPALLLIFSFGYLFLVFLTAVFNTDKKGFLILPVLATGVAVLLWHRQQPETNLLSWLEMDSGQSAARYSASLEMLAAGKWKEAITLPIEAAFSAASTNPAPAQANQLSKDTVTTAPEFSLLSSAKWQWQAGIDLTAPLEIKIADKQLVVTNIGPQTTESGLVIWRGKIYPLPLLMTGQSWSPDASETAVRTELVQLFLRQSVYSSAAVLIPYTANILQFNTNHHGWLLIHGSEAIS